MLQLFTNLEIPNLKTLVLAPDRKHLLCEEQYAPEIID